MSKRTLSALELAVLGLLSRSPASGYDIRKMFAESPMGHFSGSPGAIYPVLNRLVARGLLKASMDLRNAMRPRRLFTPSPEGEKAFEAWLRAPVTREDVVHGVETLTLRFAFLSELEAPATRTFLESYATECASVASELTAWLEGPGRKLDLHGRLALTQGRDLYVTRKEWAQSALAAMPGASSARKRRKAGSR